MSPLIPSILIEILGRAGQERLEEIGVVGFPTGHADLLDALDSRHHRHAASPWAPLPLAQPPPPTLSQPHRLPIPHQPLTPLHHQLPDSGQSESTDVPAQVQEPTPGCRDADGIPPPGYTANHMRAQETFIGERVCLRGTISGFYESNRGVEVGIAVGEDADFRLARITRDSLSWADGERMDSEEWRAWVLSELGDTIEAECKIWKFTPTGQAPKRTPGIPMFIDCQRVVGGVTWAPPTSTPLPTPTPAPAFQAPRFTGPCVSAELGDPFYEWLVIDCPAGKVTLGRGNYHNERGVLLFLHWRATIVSFYFRSLRKTNLKWALGATGRGTTGREGAKEIWDAPSDVAANFISQWRSGQAVELSTSFGECCSLDTWFDLSQPWDAEDAE